MRKTKSRLVEKLSTRQVRKIVRDLGLSISDDGLAFTVCGGQLLNGHTAPEWIADLNGCDCFEVAEPPMPEPRTHMPNALLELLTRKQNHGTHPIIERPELLLAENHADS